MDIRQIQYFIRVYEERSFSRAAEKANVVQPALSMQMRRLEEELGTQLFDRTPRGIEPTLAGDRLYQLSLPIVRSIAEARQEIIELSSGTRIAGSLRVGTPPSLNRGILGDVLSRYAEAYPEVDVAVTEAYSDTLTSLVQQGALDLAIGAAPSQNTGLHFRMALRDRLMLVTGFPINGATLTPCRLSDLTDLNLILPTKSTFLGAALYDHIVNGDISPKRTMQIEGVTATIETARSSEWAAIFPFVSMIRELHTEQLYLYPIIAPSMRFNLFFVYDPRRPLSAAARAFSTMIEDALRAVDELRKSTLGDET